MPVAPCLPHLPLEVTLYIIPYSDLDTLFAFTRVSKACRLAAQRQLNHRTARLESWQLARLLLEFINTRANGEAANRIKSIERLELVHYAFNCIPVRLMWEAAALAGE